MQTLANVISPESMAAFQLSVASMTPQQLQEVAIAIQTAHAEGRLAQLDLEQVIADAQASGDAREAVEDLLVAQAEAADIGDYAGAEAAAGKVGEQLSILQDRGADPLAAWQVSVANDMERQSLQFAEVHQAEAVEAFAAGIDAAQAGDVAGAQAYMIAADAHAAVAMNHADAGSMSVIEAQSLDTSDTGCA